MRDPMRTMYILKAISKGLSTYFFVMLPVFYTQDIISFVQIRYIGALSITYIVAGAFTLIVRPAKV